jgi:hypothetical protein
LLVAVGCCMKETIRMAAFRTSPIRWAHTDKTGTTTQSNTYFQNRSGGANIRVAGIVADWRNQTFLSRIPRHNSPRGRFLAHRKLSVKRLYTMIFLFATEERRCESYQLTDH